MHDLIKNQYKLNKDLKFNNKISSKNKRIKLVFSYITNAHCVTPSFINYNRLQNNFQEIIKLVLNILKF